MKLSQLSSESAFIAQRIQVIAACMYVRDDASPANTNGDDRVIRRRDVYWLRNACRTDELGDRNRARAIYEQPTARTSTNRFPSVTRLELGERHHVCMLTSPRQAVWICDRMGWGQGLYTRAVPSYLKVFLQLRQDFMTGQSASYCSPISPTMTVGPDSSQVTVLDSDGIGNPAADTEVSRSDGG